MARARNQFAIAHACAVRFEGTNESGTLTVPFLGSDVSLAWPELEMSPPTQLPDHVLALLLYYFAISDGTEPTGVDISFAQLPSGEFYVQAFRGYTTEPLARHYAASAAALVDAVEAMGGVPEASPADRAWRIPALPRVPLLLMWWDADDEFEARAELLFDETASHHLPTDGCAVLGSWLSAMLRR